MDPELREAIDLALTALAGIERAGDQTQDPEVVQDLLHWVNAATGALLLGIQDPD